MLVIEVDEGCFLLVVRANGHFKLEVELRAMLFQLIGIRLTLEIGG